MKRLWVPIAILAFAVNLLFRGANISTTESVRPAPKTESQTSEESGKPLALGDSESDAKPAYEAESGDTRVAVSPTVVPFGGAESVEVRLRKPAKYRHPRPNELVKNLEYYRELARSGDHEVSVKLGNAMRTCEILAPSSEDELARVIDEFYQTRTLPLAVGGSMDLSGDEDIHELAANFTEVSRNCWQLTDEDRIEANTWLEAAAKDHYLPALSQLGFSQSGTAEGFATIERMWRLGNIHALHQLAGSYRNGRGVERDATKAYAYDYLHSHIKTLDYETHGKKVNLARTPNRLKYLAHIESGMRDYEIEAGRALARDILLANANCCESWYRPEP